MKNKSIIFLIIIIIINIFIIGCREDNKTIIPEDIISRVTNNITNTNSYYIKTKNTTNYRDNPSKNIEYIKNQWVKDRQIRTDVEEEKFGKIIDIYNGERLLTYTEGEKEAEIINMDYSYIIENSVKDIFKNRLNELVYKDYNMEYIGGKKINNKDTYHLKLKTDNMDDLEKECNLYIDKYEFILLKEVREFRDGVIMTMEVLEYEEDSNMDDNIFDLEIDKDIKIIDKRENRKEGKSKLNKANYPKGLLYIPEDENIKLEDIKSYKKLSDDELVDEINLDYIYKGKTYFSFSLQDEKSWLGESDRKNTILVDDREVYLSNADEFILANIIEEGIVYTIGFFNETDMQVIKTILDLIDIY